MRRGGWTLRSVLWFVFLVALGLKAATGTWDNLKRCSIDSHRALAVQCKSLAEVDREMAAGLRDTMRSRPNSNPAISAEMGLIVMQCGWSAKSHSLLAASLSEKAEMCEKSRLGWIFWQYELWRNPPPVPLRRVHVRPAPWIEYATRDALFRHPVMMTLGNVEFSWVVCLVLAIVARSKFTRVRGSSTGPG